MAPILSFIRHKVSAGDELTYLDVEAVLGLEPVEGTDIAGELFILGNGQYLFRDVIRADLRIDRGIGEMPIVLA
jgi:hypothetical protein